LFNKPLYYFATEILHMTYFTLDSTPEPQCYNEPFLASRMWTSSL